MAKTTQQLLLSFEKESLKKLERKAKRLGFTSVQKYIYDILRRSMLNEGGRKRMVIDPYVQKFASPTKETYKILRQVRGPSPR